MAWSTAGIIRKNSFFLWSPTTKEYKRLLDTYFDLGDSYGLGYDYKTNDYKLVNILEWIGFVYIYSLKSNSWRRFSLTSYPWKIFRSLRSISCDLSGVHFNGALHWLKRKGNSSSKTIVSMDIFEERFKELQLPMTLHSTYIHFINVGVLEECLCILVHVKNTFEVWVMHDYGVRESWTRLYTIAFAEASLNSYTSDVKLIGSFKNSEILLKNLQTDRKESDSLILYDTNCGTARKPNLCGFQIGRAVSYFESLVSLKSVTAVET